MTKLFAVFASVILVVNFSACEINPSKETDGPSAVSYAHPQTAASAKAAGTSGAQTLDSASSPLSAPQTPDFQKSFAPLDTVIDNNNITIIPQQDNRIIITYPKHEINEGDIRPSDQNYTLKLKPGDYSDPQNAITTFLYDLYMKQSFCFENIHRDIITEPSTQAFVKSLYSMEDMILNMGQIDVLVLPKLKYDEDGVPFVYKNAAAYKTTEDNVIRFGNTCGNDDLKQIAKGYFFTDKARLFFETTTCATSEPESKTYFEALKKENGDFIYRSFNICQGGMQCVFITVSDELMQAGFSRGILPRDFVFTPLTDTPTLEASDQKNSLTPLYYLFASGDGAMITTPDEKKELNEPEDK